MLSECFLRLCDGLRTAQANVSILDECSVRRAKQSGIGGPPPFTAQRGPFNLQPLQALQQIREGLTRHQKSLHHSTPQPSQILIFDIKARRI
jgi:hypothetical protein